MQKIHFRTKDNELDTVVFINMANQVWAGNYQQQYTKEALKKTINTTAWDNGKLVGCVRVLTELFLWYYNRNSCFT